MYHGVLLSLHHLYTTNMPAAVSGSRWYRSPLMTVAATLVTFVLVTIGWVPFMTDLPKAMTMLRIMFTGA
jgi:D-alanyl-lipoteichoic acid acyltransferase DltB (MBOAT superfamily)